MNDENHDVGPITVDTERRYTVPEAARMLSRQLRLVQRWVQKAVQDGTMTTSRDPVWPHAQLLSWGAIEQLATKRRRRQRRPRMTTLTTEAGRAIRLRATQTQPAEPVD